MEIGKKFELKVENNYIDYPETVEGIPPDDYDPSFMGVRNNASALLEKGKAIGDVKGTIIFRPDDSDQNSDPYETLSEEELTRISEETARVEERSSRCLPSMFKDKAFHVRWQKAMVINLYFEYGGNWSKVIRDKRAVGRRTLQTYFQDEIFRARVQALDPLLTMEAKGVVVEIMSEGQDEKTRLAAALRWLEYADGESWDRGVRRQVVANKGAIQNTILSQAISDKDYLEILCKDKLNKLPEAAREAIANALSQMEQGQILDVTPTEGVKDMQELTTRNVDELKDPFD